MTDNNDCVRGRRATFLARLLSPALPACADGSSAKIFPALAQVSLLTIWSQGNWTVRISISQILHYCTTRISNWPLFNSTSYTHFIQLTVELGFYYSIIPKPFVTTACKFNSSRKFSLFFTHFSSSAPAKPKFCNPYFYCLRPRRNTILQIINAVFLGYFRNVFIVFIISFCLCQFLEQNTFPFEKLNTI